MLLAIDIGNTNTVLGVFDGEKLDGPGASRRTREAPPTSCVLTYRGLLADHPVDGIAACSTVPAAMRELRQMLAGYYGDLPTVLVEPGIRTGVSLQYENPKEVGADRIVNTLAAYHLVHGPAIVVDFGTTTNFDVGQRARRFHGRALAPGIEVSLDALAARAAQLRKVELVEPRWTDRQEHGRGVAVRDPVRLRRSGRRAGAPAAGRAGPDDPESVAVIATGGLAPLVIRNSETVTRHEPDLTLLGLRLVYERNV